MNNPKWKTEKRLYEVVEGTNGKRETYSIKVTGKELAEFLQAKRDAYGYIEGLGGDKKYYCYAVDINDWLK